MKNGNLEFVAMAGRLLRQRINESKGIFKELIQHPQNFEADESFETDWEHRGFADTRQEWKDEWRKFIKYQVLTTYIASAEAATSNVTTNLTQNALSKIDPKIEAESRRKVEKNMDAYFERLIKETEQDRIDAFIDCVATAFDPHSGYLAPQQKDDFDIGIKGSLEGIGAVLQEEDGYIKVARVVPGGPAWKQKELKAQDIILKVAQGDGEPVDIVGVRVQDAVKLIRGKKGTQAKLTVKKPEGKIVVIPIVRDVVVLEESYSKSAVLAGSNGRRYGYILLPGFYRDFSNSKARNASDDLRMELERLKSKQVDGVILDLRNNGGGALEDAVKIAGLFIPYGPVVQVRDRINRGYVYEDSDPSVAYDGEVVILVNAFSASASEIVAAALQDYGRAVVVGGDHTYGKGTVQSVSSLDLPWLGSGRPAASGSVKITNQKYYRITGGSTQFKGVEADVVLPDVNDYLDVGEQSLSYALPWSTTSSSNYVKWVNAPNHAALKMRSAKRVQNSLLFKAIDEQEKLLRARRKSTSVSLNFAKAVQTQMQLKKESEALDKLKINTPNVTVMPSDDNWLKHLEPERRDEYSEWSKGLPKDAYIDEAIRILEDWRELNAPVSQDRVRK
ncbi:tail-specific protease [bacterium]|nr:tail-specific protease [bacterium]